MERKLQHSMLTTDTLTRFEKLVDVSTLTEKQIAEIEHCAYCANMGANDKQDTWKHFAYLVKKYTNIDLETMEIE